MLAAGRAGREGSVATFAVGAVAGAALPPTARLGAGGVFARRAFVGAAATARSSQACVATRMMTGGSALTVRAASSWTGVLAVVTSWACATWMVEEPTTSAATVAHIDVGVHVLRGERHPVDDGVELPVAERGADRRRVADVGADGRDAVGERVGAARRGGAAVQDGDVETALDGEAGDGGADDAGAADDEDAEGHGV